VLYKSMYFTLQPWLQLFCRNWFVIVCSKNANHGVRDRDGLLALHHAVLRNNRHIVEILLSRTAALTVGTYTLAVGRYHHIRY